MPEAKNATQIIELVNQAVDESHRVARGLQPVEIEAEGLMYALQELAASTGRLFNVPCVFRFRKPVLIKDNVTAIHLYRIAQEAVTNAVKHAKPTRLFIGLAANRHRVILTVKDNGLGFCPEQNARGGMGLQIMHYRARTIGGQLFIRTGSNSGTRIACLAPIRHLSKPH